MLHPGALTQKKWKKKFYLFILRKILSPQKISFHATDIYEADLIKHHFGNKYKIHIASNIPELITPSERPQKKVGSLSLLSVCLISPMKNILYVIESLRHCSMLIEYTIVGPVKDDQYWMKCLETIKSLPSNISVNIIGEVLPEQLHLYYHKSLVFILPSKSENYGHAIIEALQHGLPVITSHHTPWNQLEDHNAGINIQTEKNEILKSIQFFAEMSNEMYQQWSKGALDFVAKKVNRNAVIQEYVNMFSGNN